MTFLDVYKIITTFADEMAKRTLEDFYKESKRIREVLPISVVNWDAEQSFVCAD